MSAVTRASGVVTISAILLAMAISVGVMEGKRRADGAASPPSACCIYLIF